MMRMLTPQNEKRIAWEDAVYEARGADEYGVCCSDAQGIAEAKPELVDALYLADKTQVEAAKSFWLNQGNRTAVPTPRSTRLRH